MEHRRRPYLAAEGEALVLGRSAFDLADRLAQLSADSGLPTQAIVANPLLSVPVPIQAKNAGPRGFHPGLNPALLWHPFFWLPERVAYRYRFGGAGDPDDFETEAEWVVRVGLELTISGLYDPETGTWLDILSVVGLDADDPAVQQRLTAWLHGTADPILDGIDLTAVLDAPADPHWALTATAELLPTLQPASWALLANDLASELSEPKATYADALVTGQTVANLAIGTLSHVPARTEHEPAPITIWQHLAQRLAHHNVNDTQAITADLHQLAESLYAIREDFWAFAEALDEQVRAQENETAA